MQKMISLPNLTRPTFIEKFFTFTITYHYENLFEILYSSPSDRRKYLIAQRITNTFRKILCGI